jgi:sugar phosphate isomerase/epimerase
MRSASALDAEMIVFGCGSRHPTFPYGAARENHKPETRALLVESLREVARHAQGAGLLAAVEVHVLTTLDTPEHVLEIVDAVDSAWLRVNLDSVNFLDSVQAVYSSGERFRHAATTLAPRLAPSAHIKDVVIEPDLVVKISEAPAGQGIVDLEAMIAACAEHLPDGGALIVEHFGAEESEIALRNVSTIARRLGVL